MSGTPETDAAIADEKQKAIAEKRDDFAYYFQMAGRLAYESARFERRAIAAEAEVTALRAKAAKLLEQIEDARCAFGEHPDSEIDLAERISELRDLARKPFHEGTESMREKDQLRAKVDGARVAIAKAPHAVSCKRRKGIGSIRARGCTCWKSAALALLAEEPK